MIKWHNISCLTLPIFLSLSLSVLGQPKFDNARYFDSKDGLPHDHVNDIVQDENGFIWLGTHGGLSRFDGSQFKNYYHDPNDSNSLVYNGVSRILPDGNRIWASSLMGLSALDILTDSFTRYVYTTEGERVNTIPSNPLRIAGLYKDQKGVVWCSTRGNGFGRYNAAEDAV